MTSLRASSLALVLAATAFVAAGASAQNLEKFKNSTPEQRATIQTEFMTAKIPLTPEQVPKVKAINLASAEKADPILKGDDGPLVKMRALKVLDEAKDSSLRAVLTPEQFVEYLALKEKIREELEAKLVGGGA
jgi:hypothetical protein